MLSLLYIYLFFIACTTLHLYFIYLLPPFSSVISIAGHQNAYYKSGNYVVNIFF